MPRKVYIRSIVSLGESEPDLKGILTPIEARRLGRLLKRALWASVKALEQAAIKNPDAIITATDYGCLENSIEFLKGVCEEDGAMMRPVHFMQSTHNTIGSLIGIRLKCHGYNTTYSHRGNSMESALLDAWLQISQGNIDNALVGWYDESAGGISREHALAMVLTSNPDSAIQEIRPPFNIEEYA